MGCHSIFHRWEQVYIEKILILYVTINENCRINFLNVFWELSPFIFASHPCKTQMQYLLFQPLLLNQSKANSMQCIETHTIIIINDFPSTFIYVRSALTLCLMYCMKDVRVWGRMFTLEYEQGTGTLAIVRDIRGSGMCCALKLSAHWSSNVDNRVTAKR